MGRQLVWHCNLLRTCFRQFRTQHVAQLHDEIRVRFAPSPTGKLHLGGLRTALYNYIFSKRYKGKFVLRVEDTDQKRTIAGAVDEVVKTLRWCGIEIDEGPFGQEPYGPYFQSERLELYKRYADQLLEDGQAYPCFCTFGRLELLRIEQEKKSLVQTYDNRCRLIPPDEAQSRVRAGERHTLRFKLRTDVESFEDVVYGHIRSDAGRSEGDPVIFKSDGFPMYILANVVDDHLMRISHVLRGNDFLTSTVKHVMLYRALGWTPPVFAHLPNILNKDGVKLSKRNEDAPVQYYRDAGYEPEAVLNMLTAAGGGFLSSTSGMRMRDLINNFDLAEVRNNSARADHMKMRLANRKHIRQRLERGGAEAADLVHRLRAKLVDHHGDRVSSLSDEYLLSMLEWSKDRIYTISDLCSPEFDFIWLNAEGYLDRIELEIADAHKLLTQINEKLGDLDFQPEAIRASLSEVAVRNSVKLPVVMRLLRVVLTGLSTGPPVAELLLTLGRASTQQRLRRVITAIDAQGDQTRTHLSS